MIIIASGPSFTEDQVPAIVTAQRAGFKVIVVNDNYRRVPSADLLFAGDYPWWQFHVDAVLESGFAGELWTQSRPAAKQYALRYVYAQAKRGLCRTPGVINAGGSSGFMAINLAWHFGARIMILVGFDCTNTGGMMHWFGNHPHPLPAYGPYRSWLASFPEIARDLEADGVDVVITGSTALQCWRLVDIKSHIGLLLC